MSTKIPNFSWIAFPTHVTARDYHEFDGMIETLRQFGVKGVKYREIGFSGTSYHAVFYTKKTESTLELIDKITKKYGDE